MSLTDKSNLNFDPHLPCISLQAAAVRVSGQVHLRVEGDGVHVGRYVHCMGQLYQGDVLRNLRDNCVQ